MTDPAITLDTFVTLALAQLALFGAGVAIGTNYMDPCVRWNGYAIGVVMLCLSALGWVWVITT